MLEGMVSKIPNISIVTLNLDAQGEKNTANHGGLAFFSWLCCNNNMPSNSVHTIELEPWGVGGGLSILEGCGLN